MVNHGKNLIAVFGYFFASKNKTFLEQWDWALGHYSTKFKHFTNFSKFPNILSLKWFGNF